MNLVGEYGSASGVSRSAEPSEVDYFYVSALYCFERDRLVVRGFRGDRIREARFGVEGKFWVT